MILSDIVQAVIYELSQVPGTSVQTYSSPRISRLIQNGFDLVFKQRFWDEHCVWYQRDLDGSTGSITSVIDILKFDDIQLVKRAGSDRDLARLPNTVNPFRLTGTSPRYIDSSIAVVGKPLVVYPVTATQGIVIRGRVMPDAFTDEDEVTFDALALQHYACWQYMEQDASNPGGAENFKNMFAMRMTQLERAQDNKPIELDPRVNYVNDDQWYERP